VSLGQQHQQQRQLRFICDMLDTMSKEKETQGKGEQTFLWLSCETSVLRQLQFVTFQITFEEW
jgi:hypothetical protein